MNDDLTAVFDDKRKPCLPGSLVSISALETNRSRCLSVFFFYYFTTLTSHSFHILFPTDQMKGFVSIVRLLDRYIRRISDGACFNTNTSLVMNLSNLLAITVQTMIHKNKPVRLLELL